MSRKNAVVLGVILIVLIGLTLWFEYESTHAPSELVNRFSSEDVEYQSPFDAVSGAAVTEGAVEKENIDAIK